MRGRKVFDLVHNLALSSENSADFSKTGFICNANGKRATTPTPTWLQITSKQFSVAAKITVLGTPTANCGLFGSTYTNDGSSPYYGPCLRFDNSSVINTGSNDGAGHFYSVSAASALVTGRTYTVVGAFDWTNGASGKFRIYVNGVLSGTYTDFVVAPSYGANPIMCVGDMNDNRNANCIIHACYMWDKRTLNDTECKKLQEDFYAFVKTPRRRFHNFVEAPVGGISSVQLERRQPRGELRGVLRGVI